MLPYLVGGIVYHPLQNNFNGYSPIGIQNNIVDPGILINMMINLVSSQEKITPVLEDTMLKLLTALESNENSDLLENFDTLLNEGEAEENVVDQHAEDENLINPFEELFGNNFNPLPGLFPTLFGGNANNAVTNPFEGENSEQIQADLAKVFNLGKIQDDNKTSIYDVSIFANMAQEEMNQKIAANQTITE